MKVGGEEEGRKHEGELGGKGGGAGRKIPRACTLGDHTPTQRHSGGRSHLLTGGKNGERLLARKMKTDDSFAKETPATRANVK